MPRKKLIRTSLFSYHVSGRVNNREEYPCEINEVWKYCSDELFVQSILRNARIHAFVLMPNHFHLLLTTPGSDLDEVMREWMGSTTRIVNTRSRRTGHLYGSRYFWSLIQDPIYFAHAYKYVYRNPVKAKLCERVENYPYSTFGQVIGSCPPVIPLSSPSVQIGAAISKDPFEQMEWLNRPYRNEESEAIRKALRRREFKIPLNRATRKPMRIASEL